MIKLLSVFIVILNWSLSAQTMASAPSATQSQAELTTALLGQWTGVLEYRDYKEPSTSVKVTKLPVWLRISQATEGLYFDYTYDDGPNKIISGHNALVLDLAKAQYEVVGTDAVIESLSIHGIESLRHGRGELILSGKIEEDGKPADARTRWTIGRNLLTWFLETRPASTTEPFVFRHSYTFTRATAPVVTPPR